VDTKSTFYNVKPYSSNAAWPKVIEAADNYLRRLPSALLCLKGERLPNLSEVAEAPATVWKLTTIANWYGESERTVEIASQTAVWYSTGLCPPCPASPAGC
jgi:hypothetical protein